MIQPKRTYGDKIMETLEKSVCLNRNGRKIFSYVSGERGRGSLTGFNGKDFTSLPRRSWRLRQLPV